MDITDLLDLELLVRDFSLLPNKRIHGLLIGKHSSFMRGRGMDFIEVRRYDHGDDIRNIDWKATARRSDTYTKVFEEEKQRCQLVLLNQDTSMVFGSVSELKINSGLQVASLHAFRALKMGDRVSIWSSNSSMNNNRQFCSTKVSLLSLLESLLETNNQELEFIEKNERLKEHGSFSNFLKEVVPQISHDYIIQVVTDVIKLTAEDVESLIALSLRNDLIVTHIEDPMDCNLPQTSLDITDGINESSLLITPDEAQLFHDDYERRMSQLRDRLMVHQIPLLVVNTQSSLKEQIIDIVYG
ncbi:DUF58 domain-containing protein [Halosquirtibacter laminarini]|uniref:DUF58 domain-containing protein n=1 Tax=Halosquirtibacter laminarini TaxID=3374600 RepID=A0AC61NMK4_9BACT|nr:DUF58 domain-containing protein [Prolixibacteraceae bacterium]